MTHPVISKCPICGHQTTVTEVSCTRCDIHIGGEFTLSRYDSLAPEHLQFLEAFLRSRGVIRDVEAALGISYPTVRARLDSLLEALNFTAGATAVQEPEQAETVGSDKATRRREILAAISAGTMDAETGLNALQSL